MLKIITIMLFILIPVESFSQSTRNDKEFIKGGILSLGRNNPITYASIGILGTTYGTVSDTSGEYILKYPDSLSNVKIKISCIGYADTVLKLANLYRHQNMIYLRPITVSLKGIEVYSLKHKFKEIGKLKKKGIFWLNFGGVGEDIKRPELGTEIAQKFKIKFPTAKLINLAFILYHSQGLKNLKFRLKVYSIQNDLPDSLLNLRDIIIDIKASDKPVFSIDLSKYNIYVHSDIIVSLQLLNYALDTKNKDNDLSIMIPARISLFHTAYGRKGSQDKWNSYKTMSVSYELKYDH